MTTLVLFLIVSVVWIWICSAIVSYGLFVGYFDGMTNEIDVTFDCLERDALLLVAVCLFGGPIVLITSLWVTQLGRYGLVWRWKNA